MKKKLLLSLIVISSISMGNAQKLSKSDVSRTKVQTLSHLNITKSSSPIKVIDTKSTSFVRNDFQLTSSGSKNNTAVTKTKFKDGAVQRNLFLNTQDRLTRSLSTSPIMKQQAAIDTTFYESWEAYDGTTENWIPGNWSELNKTGNAFVTGTTNPTWFVRDVGNSATNGKNIAWINYDDTGLNRDEWMISPAFTPVTFDFLAFDLYYSPFYMYFDMAAYNLDGTKQFNFSKPTSTMQVMVSTDDGINWTKIWDTHNFVGQYNETNIYDYQDGSWNSFNMSMANYLGKSIKIAFRYFGKGGDSMGLDNIGIRLLKPEAKYGRPQGYFYLGYSPTYAYANTDLMLGAAFQKDNWKNNSNHDSQSFMWTFEDQKDEKATFSTTDIYPQVEYPNGFFAMPKLQAKVGAFSSDYKWGDVNSGFLTGGSNAFDWGTVGAGNYDFNAGIGNYTFAADDYIFGTGPKKVVDGIVNYFEKPAQKYLLDSLWIGLGTFSAPAGTVFKLRIRKIDEATGSYTTILGTATCSTEDVKEVSPGYYTMPFKGFVTYDPVLELEVTNDYLEIQDAILIEMYGFNKPGIALSAFCQGIMSSGESNAYVFYNDYAGGKRLLRSAQNYFGGSTSLLFNLGVTYTYLHADESTFVAPTAGGSKTFNVTSYALPADWWMNEALPTWLTSSQTYDEATGAITYTLTAEPLPVGVTGRGANVTVSSVGADMSINVSQGDYTAVSNPKVTNTKVHIVGDNLELNYTTDFNAVAIYNVAGQLIGNFNLPSNGKTYIPAVNLKKGLYLLNFTGINTETVKVIR